MGFAAGLNIASKLCGDAQLFGAFACGDTLSFTLTLSRRLGASRVAFCLRGENGDVLSQRAFIYDTCRLGTDIYTLDVPLECTGLFFYDITYRGADGEAQVVGNRQLTVYDGDFTTPDWIKGGTMYQIFVDRFARGGNTECRGDAVMLDWERDEPEYAAQRGGRIPNNTFFGGTLYGVVDKLDYIASLGVNCIYLCPVFEAYSNHKYDTGDYEKVDSMFGGDAALDLLIKQAGKRGIRIILDGVFNHTGDDSRYFNRRGRYGDGGAYNDRNSEYYDWYTFEGSRDKYECWWGIDILPRVKGTNPSWINYICGDGGIVQRYINKGIAGWRLDVADELDDAFLCRLRASAKSADGEALVLGEVWEDASNKISYGQRRSYLQGEQLDSVMNYTMREAIIDFVTGGCAENFARRAGEQYYNYPKCSSDASMNLLGTHDTARILNVLGAPFPAEATNAELCSFRLSDDEIEMAKKRLRAAWLICATLPGVPCIYYGDEAGMQGWGDPFCRRPFPWGHEDGELTDFYRAVGALRKSCPVYREGVFRVEYAKDGLLAFSRSENGFTAYTCANMRDTAVALPVGVCDMLTGLEVQELAPGCAVLVSHKKQ